MRTFAVLLSCVASSLAYFVTYPGGSAGWESHGGQGLAWDRVRTDPTHFAVVLDNQSIPGFKKRVVDAYVDGTTGYTVIYPPNGVWPTGSNFRLNLVKDAQSVNTILAQSPPFTIYA